MRIAEVDVLILPGSGDAGPEHWQSRWAARFSTGRIVEPADWRRPQLADWMDTLVTAVEETPRPVVLVAHSLAVSVLVHAAPRFPEGKVRGALLVAPLDHEGDELPASASGFGHVPRDPLPFPSLLVASTDDGSCSVERAVDMATAWGSELHLAHRAGHLDAASGHGPWPEGLLIFTRLMQRLRPPGSENDQPSPSS